MVKETVFPCAATAREPVTATVPAASVALMMSSAVMLVSTEMVAAALVSTVWVEVAGMENELALSVLVTV